MAEEKAGPTRRQFMESGARLALIIPLASIPSARVWSAELPIVAETDPVAGALGYKHDASKVDIAKYPKRAGAEGATQFCHNCLQFAATGDGWGTCTILPGKRVASEGWCNVWVLKP